MSNEACRTLAPKLRLVVTRHRVKLYIKAERRDGRYYAKYEVACGSLRKDTDTIPQVERLRDSEQELHQSVTGCYSRRNGRTIR
jgi:hypothetical protein